MRTLKFIVDGLTLKQDPTCDFNNLTPGSEDCLKAEFSFSNEWRNITKVVGFYSRLGYEYAPQLLEDGRSCQIPSEAAKRRMINIRVIGKTDEGILRTNKLTIEQKGG